MTAGLDRLSFYQFLTSQGKSRYIDSHIWYNLGDNEIQRTENVEAICKVLHIPSMNKMVSSISQHPEMASKTDECLCNLPRRILFNDRRRMHNPTQTDAFYADATVSLGCTASSGQCVFSQKPCSLSCKFSYLFLLSSRYLYDPHTYWILTGIAARIGQRIGLHRDGEKLGLPPFDVEMRPWLFY